MGVASEQVIAAATCGSCRSKGKSVEVGLLPRLPAIFSHASPMVGSWRPLPSLLGLFGALLMLSPEVLMGNPEGLFDVRLTYPGVQKALAFAVEEYNQNRTDITNYFKLRGVLKAQSQVKNGKVHKYRFQLELVETTCEKKTDTMTYKKIQKCKRLPGKQKKQTCYFKVILLPLQNLAVTACT